MALFGARADKNLRSVLYDNETRSRFETRPVLAVQTSCSRWTIKTRRCIVASASPASATAAAAAVGLDLSVVFSIISRWLLLAAYVSPAGLCSHESTGGASSSNSGI